MSFSPIGRTEQKENPLFAFFSDQQKQRKKESERLLSDMALQLCNRRVTQVTTNLLRQVAKPLPMKVEDDHHEGDHTHIAVPKTPIPQTYVSMSKQLLRGNLSITTGLSSA